MGRLRVVGVAADVRQSVLHDAAPLTFYVPYAQANRSELVFAVRTRSDPATILPAMRAAVWRVDGDLAIATAGSLDAALARSAGEERFRTFLISAFAILATVLAAVGILGVTARSVALRTRELAIRKPLGARNRALMGGVVKSAAATGGAGVLLGLAGAFWVTRLMARFLFGIGPFDIPTYTAVSALFMAVCVVASYLPARWIARVDPVRVLNSE